MFFRKKKHAGNDNAAVPAQPTLIGAGTELDGNLVSDGEVHVAGLLRGLVKAGLCFVDTNGLIDGQVVADEIVVSGRVIGPLQARHVHLRPGCVVEGDITSETIEVDNGAKLSGAVWQTGATATNGHAALPPYDSAGDTTSGFQTDSLWGSRPGDDARPLKAVRPLR